MKKTTSKDASRTTWRMLTALLFLSIQSFNPFCIPRGFAAEATLDTAALSESAEINTGAVVLEEPSPEPLDAQTETFENNTLSAATPEELVSAAQLNTDTSVTTMTTTASVENISTDTEDVTGMTEEETTTNSTDTIPVSDTADADGMEMTGEDMDSGLKICSPVPNGPSCIIPLSDGGELKITKTSSTAVFSGGSTRTSKEIREYRDVNGVLEKRETLKLEESLDATGFKTKQTLSHQIDNGFDVFNHAINTSHTSASESYEKDAAGMSRVIEKDFLATVTLAGATSITNRGAVLYNDPSDPNKITDIEDLAGANHAVDGVVITQDDANATLLDFEAIYNPLLTLIFAPLLT